MPESVVIWDTLAVKYVPSGVILLANRADHKAREYVVEWIAQQILGPRPAHAKQVKNVKITMEWEDA